jgi:Bor protein
MRNSIKTLIAGVIITLSLSSCFNSRIMVGDITATQPLKEVNKAWNHHLIFGLVPLSNTNMNVKEFLPEGQSDYLVKTNRNFVNYIVGAITFGIYTPTQTKFYIPMK